MATGTKTPVPNTDTAEEWEDIKVGLGREWDLEQDGIITGVYRGQQTLDVKDTNSNDPDATRETKAYAIEVLGTNDPNRFIWGSYNLDQAFESITIGDMVRIEYLGLDRFQGDSGPQTVKTYRVQRRANPNA